MEGLGPVLQEGGVEVVVALLRHCHTPTPASLAALGEPRPLLTHEVGVGWGEGMEGQKLGVRRHRIHIKTTLPRRPIHAVASLHPHLYPHLHLRSWRCCVLSSHTVDSPSCLWSRVGLSTCSCCPGEGGGAAVRVAAAASGEHMIQRPISPVPAAA